MDDYYQYMHAIADGSRTDGCSGAYVESTFNPQFTEGEGFQVPRLANDVSPGGALEPYAETVYDRQCYVMTPAMTQTSYANAPFLSTTTETSIHKTGEGYLYLSGTIQKDTNTTNPVGGPSGAYGGALCGPSRSEAIVYKSYTLVDALKEPDKTPPVSTAPPPAVPPTRETPPVALPAPMAQPMASPPRTILLAPSAHPAATPVTRESNPASTGHQERPAAKRKAPRKTALKKFLRQPLRKIAPKPTGPSGSVRMN